MKQPERPYRFPPLERVAQGAVPASGTVGASHAEGFQRGMERGYQDGYASGLESGREAGRSQGHLEGMQQGARQGAKEARAAFDALAAPIDALLVSLKAQQDEYQAVLRKEVVDLVAKVARQVIRCELALQPVQMLALVDETLATMPPAPKGIEVFMNPGDLQRIQELAPERIQAWTLVGDPRLESGECRVKVGHQEADAGCKQRLEACMEQISEQLLEAPDDEHEADQPLEKAVLPAPSKRSGREPIGHATQEAVQAAPVSEEVTP